MITDDEDPPSPSRLQGKMLKPFKSLLTYLQKGSPSGSFPDDKTEDDAVEQENSDVLATENGDTDPLSDPLAFDHDYTALDLEKSSTVAVDEQQNHRRRRNQFTTTSHEANTAEDDENFDDDDDDDDEDEDYDNNTAAEIVFVDINRLKSNVTLHPNPIVLSSLHAPPSSPTSTSTLKVSQVDPPLTAEDRLKPGVEKPGTSKEDSESRSDGSDSGLGSELLQLNSVSGCDPQNQQQSPSISKQLNQQPPLPPLPPLLCIEPEPEPDTEIEDLEPTSSATMPPLPLPPVPVVSILKRTTQRRSFDQTDSLSPCPALSPSPSISPAPRNPLKRTSLEEVPTTTEAKRARRSVQFENVTIFYFARIQGFLCVPSVGGCTLGMEGRHMYKKTMTLTEHVTEQRRAHRQQQQLQQELLSPNLTRSQGAAVSGMLLLSNTSSSVAVSTPAGLPAASPLPPNSSSNITRESSSDDSDEEGSSASDVDADSTGFLRPVSTKQRRILLKAAGVRRIEPSEKDECRVIRTSREVCGCRCQGDCDPELCACSVNGIKCQVDRTNFPCNCTAESCGNSAGRVEFNPMRVRTHYIHTKMRLELEKKQIPGYGEVEVERRDFSTMLMNRQSSGTRNHFDQRDFVDFLNTPRQFEASSFSAAHAADVALELLTSSQGHNSSTNNDCDVSAGVAETGDLLTLAERDEMLRNDSRELSATKTTTEEFPYYDGYNRCEVLTAVESGNRGINLDQLMTTSPSRNISSNISNRSSSLTLNNNNNNNNNHNKIAGGSPFRTNILQILGIQPTTTAASAPPDADTCPPKTNGVLRLDNSSESSYLCPSSGRLIYSPVAGGATTITKSGVLENETVSSPLNSYLKSSTPSIGGSPPQNGMNFHPRVQYPGMPANVVRDPSEAIEFRNRKTSES